MPPGSEDRTRALLVRHGSTDMNDAHVMRGWKDVELNDKGVAEAQHLGNKLSTTQPDIIASSDLCRTVETAKIIAAFCGNPPIEEYYDLRPWDVGDFTGVESAKAGPIMQDYARYKPDEPLPNGESFNHYKKRTLAAVEACLRKHKNKLIVLVTHHRTDRLMAGWEKLGCPIDHSIDLDTFLDWESGIPPGSLRQVHLPLDFEELRNYVQHTRTEIDALRAELAQLRNAPSKDYERLEKRLEELQTALLAAANRPIELKAELVLPPRPETREMKVTVGDKQFNVKKE